jgi:hypothetical protein
MLFSLSVMRKTYLKTIIGKFHPAQHFQAHIIKFLIFYMADFSSMYSELLQKNLSHNESKIRFEMRSKMHGISNETQ